MTAPRALTRPEPKRDQWGRYLLPVPGKAKPLAHTRVTTLVKALDDTSNLEQWACRMTAIGLADRQDLRALVTANVDNKSALNNIVKQAKEAAKAGAGANMGTALHDLCDQVDRGDAPKLGEFAADVDAYRACLEGSGVEVLPEWNERIIRVPGLQCAGTFDRLVRIAGVTYVADIKTGSIDYGHTTIPAQLACYAHGAAWDGADGYLDLPDVDQTRGLIIHLPAGTATCALHWCDLSAGWEIAQLCYTVREWRKRKDTITTFDTPPSAPLTAVEDASLTARVDWIKGRIAELSDNGREAFRLAWTGGPVAQELTSHAGVDRVATALDQAEGTVEAPFPPSDPTVDRSAPDTTAESAEVARIDDGPEIVGMEFEAVKERLQRHPMLEQIQEWNAEANDAGHSFSIRFRRQRQVEIMRAVMLLAAQGDDMARVLLEVVMGEALQPALTTGAALGVLSIPQAVHLAELARVTAQNPDALSFSDEGRPLVAV